MWRQLLVDGTIDQARETQCLDFLHEGDRMMIAGLLFVKALLFLSYLKNLKA